LRNTAKARKNQREMACGFVTNSSTVPASRESGDTAETRFTIGKEQGCERLEQRVISFAEGRSQPRESGDRQEVLYVASGRGTLDLDEREHVLEPGTGVYVRPRETYVIANEGPAPLVLVSVTAPEEQGVNGVDRRVTVRHADQPVLPASPNREFRYLVNQEMGCPDVTQFVGVIPPGRAPLHSHVYDEVVYILEGQGVLHLGGEDTELSPGSCIHLPPLVLHSLENSGSAPMRVLGVFHPSGDPASRAVETTA
jgi:mannose-6-phosphate isomerase-like protein (cupin superfamily)